MNNVNFSRRLRSAAQAAKRYAQALFIALFAVCAFSLTSCSNSDEVASPDVRSAAAVTIVDKNIETNTTWSGEIELAKKVAVLPGATLTIEPGTTIKGRATDNPDDATALIVTKGAKIHAVGTASSPIVFTALNGKIGGWGGLMLLGKAPVNKAQPAYIEGIVPGSLPGVDTSFGGNDPHDNSGTLQYVRVEYAGATIGLNNELNSFTFGGVGDGTTIDHCEAFYGKDDAFEFFGGTVNGKYLAAIGTNDDSFDFDNGYVGKIQFAVSTAAKDSLTSDPNGIECDNDASSSDATPVTRPVLSNLTIIGLPTGAGDKTLKSAADFRRNCQFTLVNSILYGFPKGILLETKNSYELTNNVVAATTAGQEFYGLTADASNKTAEVTSIPTETKNTLTLKAPWGNIKNDDLIPTGNPALSGASFVGLSDFFEVVSYKGAFEPNAFTYWTNGEWFIVDKK